MPTHLYDPFPKYLQIQGVLKRWLASLTVGDHLPTEQKLASRFNVSRETIRQALKLLEEEGIIARRPRIGTWLAKAPGTGVDNRLTGPFEGFTSLGMAVEIGAASEGAAAASVDVAEALKLEAGASVYEFHRIRVYEGQPLVAFSAHFPLQIGRRIARLSSVRNGLFVPALRRAVDPNIYEQFQKIEALSANEQMASTLQIAQGAPLLLVRRVFVDSTGRPVVLFKSHFRADRYFYTVNLPKLRMPDAKQPARRVARPRSRAGAAHP